MAESVLTAWRRQIATHLGDTIPEITQAYPWPKSSFTVPCLLIYPGGHDDYVSEGDTTFGSSKVAMSLQFLQSSGEEEEHLAIYETVIEAIVAQLAEVPFDPVPFSAEIARVLEPRFVKFPNSSRYFAGQIDIYLHRPDPNC